MCVSGKKDFRTVTSRVFTTLVLFQMSQTRERQELKELFKNLAYEFNQFLEEGRVTLDSQEDDVGLARKEVAKTTRRAALLLEAVREARQVSTSSSHQGQWRETSPSKYHSRNPA